MNCCSTQYVSIFMKSIPSTTVPWLLFRIKDLPYSLIPHCLLPYILRLFDGTRRSAGRGICLSDPDKREVVRFLGTSFPASSRNVIIYVSYVSASDSVMCNNLTIWLLALSPGVVFGGTPVSNEPHDCKKLGVSLSFRFLRELPTQKLQ